MTGDLEGCKKELAKCDTPEKKSALLETRCSITRVTPLMATFIGYASIIGHAVRIVPGVNNPTFVENHRAVVQLLLDHGARYNANDLCGKTIIHYVSGPLCKEGDSTMMELADMCIDKSKADGLQPPLVDYQDRFGAVPLPQAIIMNREDLVKFLCEKHEANTVLKDVDGCSAYSISRMTPWHSVIVAATNKVEYEQQKRKCFQCGKSDVQTLVCARCKSSHYCSKECQKLHWKAVHKKQCLSSETLGFIVKSAPNHPNKLVLSDLQGNMHDAWTGGPTKHTKIGELFDVKIQVPADPMTGRASGVGACMCYNQQRDLQCRITETNCDKLAELVRLVHTFQPCRGLKAYFKAKIKEDGDLFIAANKLFVCNW
mmetsp:Transcript_28284/g.47553  ORF Transcript_28284/g.47553 Transcript_28284/m.47553 type:complete len:372 (+) Transcript_28284:551-1666(+)